MIEVITKEIEMKLTPNELNVLKAIDASEYGDALQDGVWTWSMSEHSDVASRSLPGVVSSLVKKGLVYTGGDGEDAEIGLTAAGVAAYVEAVGGKTNKWVRS